MTQPSRYSGDKPGGFPLSCAQEMWCLLDNGDQAGAFGPRFITCQGLRITGRLDLSALEGALGDVVERHEILRTVVVRDAEPPHQQVYPPCQVPLRLQDLRVVTGRSRDLRAEEFLLEAEQATINVRELPLLRAALGRFDDTDWVLILTTHHSASDGWSMQLIIRDLAAFYVARTTGRQAALPEARQYREFAAWQQARVRGPAADTELEYWRTKLDGAQIFALPTDRPVPELHSRPYSMHNFTISKEVMTAATALARSTRSSPFMVILAAFGVLANHISGTTDPVVNTITTGRNEPRFQDTVGPFLNFLPLRIKIGRCLTFLDVLAAARQTCLEAYSHEMPCNTLEHEIPHFMEPARRPENSDTVLGMFQPQFDGAAVRIADKTCQITERSLAPVSSDLPEGIAWIIEVAPSGELAVGVQYNLDEFDEPTIAGWVSSFRGILCAATAQPDRPWKTLG
jgi:condensation enzyme